VNAVLIIGGASPTTMNVVPAAGGGASPDITNAGREEVAA
jgi:hypothetical protein